MGFGCGDVGGDGFGLGVEVAAAIEDVGGAVLFGGEFRHDGDGGDGIAECLEILVEGGALIEQGAELGAGVAIYFFVVVGLELGGFCRGAGGGGFVDDGEEGFGNF